MCVWPQFRGAVGKEAPGDLSTRLKNQAGVWNTIGVCSRDVYDGLITDGSGNDVPNQVIAGSCGADLLIAGSNG